VPTLLGMQPRARLACWAASAHCWVLLSFSPANSPKAFSSGLLCFSYTLCKYCHVGWDLP